MFLLMEKVSLTCQQKMKKTYEKILELSKNNDYTTGYSLDCANLKENYGFIATDLSK